MRTIDDIRTECETHGICADYTDRWRSAKSRKELFDMGCSIQGMEFLVRSVNEGFGFTIDEICSMFRAYLNGRYISVQHRDTGHEYDGAIWCRSSDPIAISMTCAAIIDCKAEVRIRPHHICHVFIDRMSLLSIICPVDSSILFHGDVSQADLSRCEGRIKVIENR